MNNRNRKNNDEYTFIQSGLSIDATASFASGEVYFSNIMDNIITQAYYNPSLLSVLKKLIVGEEIQANLKSEKVISKYSNVPSGCLYLIDLPLNLFSKEKTLIEILGRDVFNQELLKSSDYYDKYIYEK